MVLIDENWETVTSLYDVSRLIREHLSTDLADVTDKLLTKETKEYEQSNEDLEDEIRELNETVDDLSYDNDVLETAINDIFRELHDKNLLNGTLSSIEAKLEKGGYK